MMVALLLVLRLISREDRQLLLRVAQFLAHTDGQYRHDLEMDISLLSHLARADGLRLVAPTDFDPARVLSFRPNKRPSITSVEDG